MELSTDNNNITILVKKINSKENKIFLEKYVNFYQNLKDNNKKKLIIKEDENVCIECIKSLITFSKNMNKKEIKNFHNKYVNFIEFNCQTKFVYSLFKHIFKFFPPKIEYKLELNEINKLSNKIDDKITLELLNQELIKEFNQFNELNDELNKQLTK